MLIYSITSVESLGIFDDPAKKMGGGEQKVIWYTLQSAV